MNALEVVVASHTSTTFNINSSFSFNVLCNRPLSVFLRHNFYICQVQSSSSRQVITTFSFELLKDEKLQDVLGHFQKDFEGGVSAENLGKLKQQKYILEHPFSPCLILIILGFTFQTGAKFGGYGSFLPTYRRSPVWSHPRTPKIQHYNSPRSPNNSQLEVDMVSVLGILLFMIC